MAAGRRNVLLIVVDQWRADFVPRLGARFLRTPNLDRLCREGVTFRDHVTTAVPCGPARASLLTGLYLMNHRAVQNTVPLDARHTNLGRELRRVGYDPALISYTTTTPDPRATGPRDPRFATLGDLMDGFRAVGAFEPSMDGRLVASITLLGASGRIGRGESPPRFRGTAVAVQSAGRSPPSHPQAEAPGHQLGRVRCRPAL